MYTERRDRRQPPNDWSFPQAKQRIIDKVLIWMLAAAAAAIRFHCTCMNMIIMFVLFLLCTHSPFNSASSATYIFLHIAEANEGEREKKEVEPTWNSSWGVRFIRTFETFKVQFMVSEFFAWQRKYIDAISDSRSSYLVEINTVRSPQLKSIIFGRWTFCELIILSPRNKVLRERGQNGKYVGIKCWVYLPSALSRQCESKTWISIDWHPNADNSKSLRCNHLTTHHWHSTKNGVFERERLVNIIKLRHTPPAILTMAWFRFLFVFNKLNCIFCWVRWGLSKQNGLIFHNYVDLKW